MMKKGNILVIVGITILCVVTAIVIVYGVLNLFLTPHMNQNEEFDALILENSISLEDMAMELEASSVIGKFRLYGGEVYIFPEDKNLNVKIISKDINYDNKFTLEQGILSVSLLEDEELNELTIDLLEEIYSMNYDNKEVILKYLDETNSELYNLENVGIQKEDEKIKLNLSKKIEYIDFSSMYLSVEDISKHKEKLGRESLTTISNDNITLIKSGYDGQVKISIAQYDEITNAAYKSLINALAVIYNYDGFYTEFIYDHPVMKFKNKTTDEYKLEINPTKVDYEKETFGEKPMIRLTIYG